MEYIHYDNKLYLCANAAMGPFLLSHNPNDVTCPLCIDQMGGSLKAGEPVSMADLIRSVSAPDKGYVLTPIGPDVQQGADIEFAWTIQQQATGGGKSTAYAEWLNFNPWQFIKANQFFKAYAPSVTKYANKMRGKDGHNKPIDFSEADKAAIRSGLDKLASQLKNALLGLLIALCVVSCSKDLPTPEQTEAAPARPIGIQVEIKPANYERIAVVVFDLNCQAVGHREFRVSAGTTTINAIWDGECTAGGARLGSVRRV